MAEIINLRQFRKQKARAEKDTQAANNRAKFGRTKAEKQSQAHEEESANRSLDGHRLGETPSDTGPKDPA